MGDYIREVESMAVDRRGSVPVLILTGLPAPTCGTVACLAGHITLQADPQARTASPGSAFQALGVEEDSPAGLALDEVFQTTSIGDYDELIEELEEYFTFPEPLPEPTLVGAK